MLVKDRVAYLRQELDRFKGFYETNQAEYNREAAVLYALLRETWEALCRRSLAPPYDKEAWFRNPDATP